MFKQLKNEVKITLSIKTDSPFLIRAAEKNVLDPSLPDSTVIRQTKNGVLTTYIPGSSLKGVFRTRAEQLLRSQGYRVENVFSKNDKKRKTEDGVQAYNDACPVGKIFGNLYLKSRIIFTDAYPISNIKTAVRTGVGIDRITGGARSGALFNSEVVEEGVFQTTITLQNFELWQLALILYMIKDLDEGYVKIGASTSRGLGKVRVTLDHLEYRYYQKISDHNRGRVLSGYSNDDIAKDHFGQPIVIEEWKNDLFSQTFSDNQIDQWIGENGYLRNIRWPAKEKR